MAKQFFDLTTTEDNKTRIDYHEDELQSYRGEWAIMAISKQHGICIGKKNRTYAESIEHAEMQIPHNTDKSLLWVLSNIDFPPNDIIEAFPIPAKD